jgi:ribose transport system permease protein
VTALPDTYQRTTEETTWRRYLRIEQAAFPAALASMIVIGAIFYPTFRTVDNLRNVITFASIPFIVAAGQTIVVLARGVDLSVGSMVALSGAVFAELYVHGYNFAISAVATLALGLFLGAAVNGVLITKLSVSFLIVTLGTFSVFRSQAQVILGGVSITVDNGTLDWLANGRIGPLPCIVIIAGLVFVGVLLLLRATTYGRAVYAVGANREAARLAGIPVDRVLIAAYGLCAGFAAFAGILIVGQLGSAQPTAGVGYELIAIASVLLGGTRFSGGYGGITNTLLGVLFFGILTNILLLAGVNSFWQGTASGLVLIAAVALDRSRRD